MSWGNEYSLAEAALKSPADQPAKQAFLADLRAKYGAITGLNAAWGTTHESWEALAGQRTAPDRKQAAPDLAAFYSRTAETYFRAVRDAIREGAPGQLYLGCRFAWANTRAAAAAAAKYCDVVSYNLYQRSIADFVFDGGADVPLIVGEFHFGALDRGMFHTGLVPVPNQDARAQAYTDYVEGALRHRQFVGTHWFQWQDEPTTGRVYDEETTRSDWSTSPTPRTPKPSPPYAAWATGCTDFEWRADESADTVGAVQRACGGGRPYGVRRCGSALRRFGIGDGRARGTRPGRDFGKRRQGRRTPEGLVASRRRQASCVPLLPRRGGGSLCSCWPGSASPSHSPPPTRSRNRTWSGPLPARTTGARESPWATAISLSTSASIPPATCSSTCPSPTRGMPTPGC